jgi:putative spermidine/putrescine transport system ATP-binding protein
MSIAVELRDVSRRFGDVRAVDRVSLAIEDGEFFSMLGPSGSGKTTCLRLIGGFELPTEGSIFLHGEDASDRPPYERDVNTVFQDYALFPHLSVLDNVAYGLRMKGKGREPRRREAAAALEQVALGGLGDRHPGQLSGGQRQRVALARALVNRPRVLLLDEPLGALDLKLREQMQVELKGLQRRLGITFIYVTHDQGEALSMSDRVAVFNHGRVEQVDRPRELYARPRTTFVAGFVGTANVLTGEVARRITGMERPVSIRPERVAFGARGPGQLGVTGRVVDVQFHGSTSRFEIDAEGARLAVTIANRDGDRDDAGRPGIGDVVELAWSPDAMVELRGSDDRDAAAPAATPAAIAPEARSAAVSEPS